MSQDNFKVQPFTGHKLPIKHKTTKNSAMSSVAHSIQSPVSRKATQFDSKKKRVSISDESTNASHAHNFQGRRTYNPKVQKKAIKKVINIPSVKIDKQLMKAQKKSKKAEKMYDMMDTIPENQDFSEIDTMSVITRTHFKEGKLSSHANFHRC